jgi:hypothetical protein
VNLGLGLSLSSARAAGGGGASYSAEATALFAQMAVQPDATRKGLINTVIVDLIAASIWTKLDWLSVMAAGTSQQALLNWKDPTQTMTVVGAVDFTTDRGFDLTARSVNDYLLLPELLTAAGNVYAQNDAHYSTYINEFAFQGFGGVAAIAGNYNTGLGQLDGTNSFWASINTTTITLTTGVDATATNYKGMWTVVRTASNAQQLYKSGTAVNGANSWTNAAASTAVPATAPRLIFGDNVTWAPPSNTTRIATRTSGSQLTSGEASTLATTLTTFLTAIGAN